ncbi:hypothetical protein [Pseudomonas sp. CHM02]|uniref:hypothetical protein n=1 Tax=Pseudomonas sp. CHM02 TaxID=1463662 RepID=UPI0012DC6369|nr:hypothetical protein [Pseudomonas sp. CHM02]
MKSAIGITFAFSFLAVLATLTGASISNQAIPSAPAAAASGEVFLASDGAENLERWHKRQA